MRQHASLLGVGNRYRGDDGVGLEVIAQLRGKLPAAMLATGDGDLTSILDCFEQHDEVVIIDALDVHAGALEPGSVVQLKPLEHSLADTGLRSSTHAMGLAEAIEMARTLGCLPRGLRLIGIVGDNFSNMEGLTPPVQAAATRVAQQLAEEFADA